MIHAKKKISIIRLIKLHKFKQIRIIIKSFITYALNPMTNKYDTN